MRKQDLDFTSVFKDFKSMDKVAAICCPQVMDQCERCATAIQPEQGLCEKCRADSDNEILASFKGWGERNAANGYKGNKNENR